MFSKNISRLLLAVMLSFLFITVQMQTLGPVPPSEGDLNPSNDSETYLSRSLMLVIILIAMISLLVVCLIIVGVIIYEIRRRSLRQRYDFQIHKRAIRGGRRRRHREVNKETGVENDYATLKLHQLRQTTQVCDESRTRNDLQNESKDNTYERRIQKRRQDGTAVDVGGETECHDSSDNGYKRRISYVPGQPEDQGDHIKINMTYDVGDRLHECQRTDVPVLDNGYERPRRITHVPCDPHQGEKDLTGAVPPGDVLDHESYKYQIDNDVSDNMDNGYETSNKPCARSQVS